MKRLGEESRITVENNLTKQPNVVLKHILPVLVLVAIILWALPSINIPTGNIPNALATNSTFTFNVSSSTDGFLEDVVDDDSSAANSWSYACSDNSATYNLNTWLYSYVSIETQYSVGDYHTQIDRSYLYFDTSSLPDDTAIVSATLRLYGAMLPKTQFGSWTLQIQNGMPTYPHNPLVTSDYRYSYYSGNGGTLSSSSMGTGYKSITLSAEGLTWVNKTGTTKFVLREQEHDINNVQPSYNADQYWNEWDWYTYEQGSGYWPQLIITLETITTPTITTNNATYVAGTSARLNSYLSDDGGEPCDVRFQYGTATGNYTYSTDWVNDTYHTGNSPYADVTTLTRNTTYYFRVQAANSVGSANGSELSFTTTNVTGAPTNLVAYPSDTSVSLTWVKGSGSTNTRIQRLIGSYPTMTNTSPTYTGYSTASDGYIYVTNATYSVAHNAISGTVSGTVSSFIIGQWNVTYYIIYRGFVFFDTSSIPASATITSAVLSLYGKTDSSAIDFNITIQNGQPAYPGDPLLATNFLYSQYTGDGGTFNTTGFTTSGYNNITMNSNGTSWIQKGGKTKLALLSSRDINSNIPPTLTHEDVSIYSYEQGADYQPMLVVNYTYFTFTGTQVYFGTMATATDTGLTPGTCYYYSAWGESGGNYSATCAQTMTTTSAGAGAGGIPTAPTTPTGWLATPDYTKLSGIPLFYPMINGIADGYGMPRNSFWVFITLLMIAIISLFIYLKSQSGVAAMIVGGVLIVIASVMFMGLLWIVFAVGVIAAGVFVQVRQA